MNKTKKAFWIIYVFFLITLILSFWVIILNKQSFFEKSIDFMQKQDILAQEILSQAKISFNENIKNNENSWNYKPFITCPQDVKMSSWSEIISTGNTIYENNMCSWSLQGETINIFFSWSFDTFSSGTLWWTGFQLSWATILEGTFSWMTLSFEKPNLFDDRFIKAKTQREGNIVKWEWYKNIFWSNIKVANFIDKNQNNTWPFPKLSQLEKAVLYFDVNDSFSGKIIQFDKNIFTTQNKLVKTQEYNFFSQSGTTWYLQENLTLSGNIWTPKIFDFDKNDYAVFLAYSTWILNNIRYTFKVLTENATGTYINPIRDDREIHEYLWNNIFIKDNQYYYKIQPIHNY